MDNSNPNNNALRIPSAMGHIFHLVSTLSNTTQHVYPTRVWNSHGLGYKCYSILYQGAYQKKLYNRAILFMESITLDMRNLHEGVS
jgi:hypothetical protein